MPVQSPFLEILARKLLKNDAAEHVIRGRLIEIVRWADVIFRASVLERHFQFHWFTAALNAKRNNVSGISVSGEQIGKVDFAVKRIDVVAILIDLIVCDRCHNVADLQATFHGRHVWLDIRDVNPGGFACLARIFSQLRIARWKK